MTWGGEGFLVLKFTLRVLLGDKMSKLDISHVPQFWVMCKR